MSPSKRFILALLLTMPIIGFVLHHYTAHSPSLYPTGFTADENVLYMSYAHQYTDQENFSIGYSNPFDGNPQSPRIYFQPATLFFAVLLKTGADPGLSFTLFGLLMAFCCIYLGILIIEKLLPGYQYNILLSVLFTWGGGLTALAGIGGSLISGVQLQSWTDAIYMADPANGWWGMNWGRTLFIPLEAFYHFLFLLNIYFILKQRWRGAVFSAMFLSMSHPFTGVEYLLIINGWLLLEKIIYRNKQIPVWVLPAHLLLLLLHAWYYLYFLSGFPEHRQLFSQYSAGWTYSFRVFIPAYALVFFIALLAVKTSKSISQFFSNPYQRLFLCWAIISFLLSKHEWFIRPMQPVHFTRGYTWAGLFLLGLPGLQWLINYGKQSAARKFFYISFILLLLLDNTLWTANLFRDKATVEWEGHITADTKEILDHLKKNSTPDDLLVGNARLVNYMANVYSSANAWVSHPYNTPVRDKRIEIMNQYFQTGIVPAYWKGRRIVIVLDKRDNSPVINPSLTAHQVFENGSYRIFIP